MRSSLALLPVLALPAAALPGCALGGALHQATLTGQCAADDAACSRRHPQAPIAIGTRFSPEVATHLPGPTTPPPPPRPRPSPARCPPLSRSRAARWPPAGPAPAPC